MKKYSIIILCFLFLIFVSTRVYAYALPPVLSRDWDSIAKIITNGLIWARRIAALLLLGYLIYGGYTKLTAGGNAEKDKEAKLIIRNAIIGFTLVMIAPIIVRTVGAILGVQSILGTP